MKKLRYGLELAVEASSNSSAADLAILRRGQTLLGRMHDLEVLIGRVRRFQARLEKEDDLVRRELDDIVIALDTNCRRLHARYVRQRTALLDVCRRLIARTPPPARVAAMSRAS
jgi:CHAD domain-containing protein